MLKQGFAAFALLALFASISLPKEEKKAGDVVADVARTLGADNLKSVQYTGTGFIFTFGQSYRPGGPWPKFRLQSYTRMADRRIVARNRVAEWRLRLDVRRTWTSESRPTRQPHAGSS
jgi:hypothetical protein